MTRTLKPGDVYIVSAGYYAASARRYNVNRLCSRLNDGETFLVLEYVSRRDVTHNEVYGFHPCYGTCYVPRRALKQRLTNEKLHRGASCP